MGEVGAKSHLLGVTARSNDSREGYPPSSLQRSGLKLTLLSASQLKFYFQKPKSGKKGVNV
jgi:hypothetical protein